MTTVPGRGAAVGVAMSTDLRVCFLGDSLVAGVGDPEHLGWVGRLAADSHRAGRVLTAYNLGIRRQTSHDVLARWHAECRARLPPEVDGRIVVSFGVNDTTHESGAPRVSPADSARHLTTLLDGTAAAQWNTLVIGPPPVASTVQTDRIEHLDRAFAAVCTTAAVPYLSVVTPLLRGGGWMDEVRSGDGAHPAAGGYRQLAGLIRPIWRHWLG